MGVIETVDIVGDLVARMPLVIDFKTVTDNLNGTYTLTICDSTFLYLKVGSKITIGSVAYAVTALVPKVSITLKGASIPSTGKVTLPAIKYYNGSILQTNSELCAISDKAQITPMAYLKRTFIERWNAEDDAVERYAQISLFFLTQANFSEWITKDHDEKAIVPMRNVTYAFIAYLRNNKQIGLIEDFNLIDRIKFGYYTDKGVENKGMWSAANLSGVELSINLPIARNYKCNC